MKGGKWWDESWNPVTGCTACSEGCAHCYAKRWHERMMHSTSFERVELHPDRLEKVERAKPKLWFVDSMSDLFHEDVPFVFIHKVFNVIHKNPLHTFVILTKRPSRMLEYYSLLAFAPGNVWMGVSAENQARADERIPLLLRAPVQHRFVCVGPMLGAVDLEPYLQHPPFHEDYKFTWGASEFTGIEGVICEGESGPLGRVMDPDWVRALRDQCVDAEVPFFFKQWGTWAPDDMDGVMVHQNLHHSKRVLDGREWNELPWGKKAPVSVNEPRQLALEEVKG